MHQIDPATDYDDLEEEERWCDEQRAHVAEYLQGRKIEHGRIGEWPAWHVAPYVSIWAVESLAQPEWIGWWVIAGDLPADCISSEEVTPPQHPRKAMRVFAKRWLKFAEAWKKGEADADASITGSAPVEELAPLLETRARLMMEWTRDDSVWVEE